jgi:hypothetical protein
LAKWGETGNESDRANEPPGLFQYHRPVTVRRLAKFRQDPLAKHEKGEPFSVSVEVLCTFYWAVK